MQVLKAIASRRGIRRFRADPVPREMVERILLAGTQAPSAENDQPWEFVVVQGDKRREMVSVMRQGLEKARQDGEDLGSSEWSATCIEQAPVTIFVFSPYAVSPDQGGICSVQSIGAAIENMLLAALDLGLGTLWLCDIYHAYRELSDWFGLGHRMVAAIAIGYPDEAPGPRPRRSVAEVTTWVG